MRNWIARFSHPHFVYPDTPTHQQARRLLLVNLAWVALVLAATPIMIAWAMQSARLDLGTVFMPVSLGLAVLCHRFIQRGSLNYARLLFVFNLLLAALLLLFPNYRLDTPFLLVATLPLVAAGGLLGRSGVLGIALILAVSITAGAIVQIAVEMEPTPAGNTPAEALRTALLVFLGVIALQTVILRLFGSDMEQTARQRSFLTGLIGTTAQISRTLTMLPGPGEELNQTLDQVREALGLYHVQVFLADPVSGLAVLRASTGFIGRRLLEEESLLVPDENSPINDALRRADFLLIRESDPAERRSGFLPATRSELLIPLRVGNLLPLGVLDLHSTNPEAFFKEILDTLTVIGSQMALVLYTLQRAHELRLRDQERDQLIEQLEAAQHDLTRANRQLIGATWGAYLEESQQSAGFAWQGGALIRTRVESEVLDHTIHDGQTRLEERAEGHILCVPIRLRGQILGAIEFRRTSGARWSPAALELAQAIAERLALSLENARLFEQAQMIARREQTVSQIAGQLQTTTDLQTLLTLAAARFQDALGASHTRVRLGTLPAAEPPADGT